MFPSLGLIVEADGYAYHSTRPAFEDDHVERLRLEAAGWRVVAVTYRQLTSGYEETRVKLRAVRDAAGRRYR